MGMVGIDWTPYSYALHYYYIEVGLFFYNCESFIRSLNDLSIINVKHCLTMLNFGCILYMELLRFSLLKEKKIKYNVLYKYKILYKYKVLYNNIYVYGTTPEKFNKV